MSESKIFILDDNADFRESTAWLLEGMGFDVFHFGEYDTALKNLSKIGVDTPACLLLDIRMPIKSGLDVHDEMIDRGIDIPVIYMTAHGDVPLAVKAMRKGAETFLEKPLDDEALESALEHALSEQVQGRRVSIEDRKELMAACERLQTLTPRERQVADGIVNERVNKEIANDLDIAVKTVELHRSRAIQKMGARNSAHLIRLMMACTAAQ